MNNVRENPDSVPGIYDEKGRRFVGQLSDRELMEEMVTTVRRTEDMVLQFVESMSSNPMMKMFVGKFGK